MAKPDNITVVKIPDGELKDFLDEVAEENKFDVVSVSKEGSTWTVKLKRKS